MTTLTVRFASTLFLLVLAACGRGENVGSPTPPASFGKIATAITGCPAIDGKYRWPPKEGRIEGYEADGTQRRDRYATPEFFGVAFPGATVFDIKREAKQMTIVVSGPPRRPPSHSEQVRGVRSDGRDATVPYECSGGWIVAKERAHPHSNARDNYGGPARLGAKLAPLEGGDLVIAQWVRVTERRGSIFTWGDQSVGNIPLPDQVYWRWARFERVR